MNTLESPPLVNDLTFLSPLSDARAAIMVEFELGYVRRSERWLESHSTTLPDAAGLREQLDEQRSRYLDGYRGTFGMAKLTLVAD